MRIPTSGPLRRSNSTPEIRKAPFREDGNVLSCRIFHTDLADAPPYKALSYTWGKPSDPRYEIIINGRPFEVRENLYFAIEHLANIGEPVTIWIDAICIDQENVEERNHQVGIMRKIYQRATQVICWLGPAYEESQLAFRLLRIIQEHRGSVDWIVEYFTHPNDGLLPSLQALARLCQRTYWFRLWIVQEISVANDIVLCCGDDSIGWEHFFDFLGLAFQRGTIRSEHGDSLLVKAISEDKFFSFQRKLVAAEALQVWKSALQSRPVRLFECLARHFYRESTDPRDKIFGLVGLGDTDDYQIEINYLLPVEKIYTDYARNEINTHLRLDILTRVMYLTRDGKKASDHNLPS